MAKNIGVATVTASLLITALICMVALYYQHQKFQKESTEAKLNDVQTKIERRFTGAALVLALRGIPRNDPRCVAICVRHVYRLRRAHLRSSFFRYTFRRRYVPHYLACRSLCAAPTPPPPTPSSQPPPEATTAPPVPTVPGGGGGN